MKSINHGQGITITQFFDNWVMQGCVQQRENFFLSSGNEYGVKGSNRPPGGWCGTPHRRTERRCFAASATVTPRWGLTGEHFPFVGAAICPVWQQHFPKSGDIVSRFFAKNKPRYAYGKGFYPGLMILGIAERVSPRTKAASFLACWITIT